MFKSEVQIYTHFQMENENALKLLKDHLSMLDGLEFQARQEALVRGVLAGNVFDWGAKEVVKLMEKGLGFKDAADRLQGLYVIFNQSVSLTLLQ